MGKRKYSYLIYDDGKKEKILNWFYANDDMKNRKIIVFTQSGTYLYVTDNKVPSLKNPLSQKIYPILKYPHAFYKLRGGVHYVDIYNADIWYAADDIDRMEIVID